MRVTTISFLFISLFYSYSSIGNKENKVSVEFYITPRNVNYGWYNNGVESFDFHKRSVKASYENRSYTTLTKSDSLYELYYIKKMTNPEVIDKMLRTCEESIDDSVDIKRIAIILNRKNKTDTIFIDRNYNFPLHGKVYKANQELSSYLENIMPHQIKENWINNLPARL